MSVTRTLPDGTRARAVPAGSRGKAGVLGTVMAVLIALQDRSRQRRHLQELDDRLLRDIGLTRGCEEGSAKRGQVLS